MVKLKEDTQIRKAFKDISDSSWDKIIIYCDNWKSEDWRNGCLNWHNFSRSMLYNNPKFFIPENPTWGGGGKYYSFPNDEVFNDVMKFFSRAKEGKGTLFFKSRDTSVGTNPQTNFGSTYKEGPMHPAQFTNLLRGQWENGNDLFSNVTYKTVPWARDNLGNTNLPVSPYCKIRSKEIFDFLKKYSNDYEIPIVYQAGIDFDEKEFAGTNVPIENPAPQPFIPAPTPTPPTPQPPTETPEEKITRLEKEKKDLEDELKRLKEEWDKDLGDLFKDDNDKGLTVDNLAKLKEKYDNKCNGLIDPNDQSSVAENAKKLGMVAKEEYQRVVNENKKFRRELVNNNIPIPKTILEAVVEAPTGNN